MSGAASRRWGGGRDERVRGLCEDLFPEMTGSAAFDGV